MAGFFDKFRKTVVLSAGDKEAGTLKADNIDDKIALGVLLWAVAEADDKFLPEEEEKIKEILIHSCKIKDSDIGLILASIQQAARERIDLYRFTHEVSESLSYAVKLSIIEDLFRVACADRDLDDSELETIRKISGLFHIDHKDFIEAKIKVKKEFGLDTAGF